ncbi:MAG TPA: hypothetical protein VGG39_02995 [Polyangiaceae bacterium]
MPGKPAACGTVGSIADCIEAGYCPLVGAVIGGAGNGDWGEGNGCGPGTGGTGGAEWRPPTADGGSGGTGSERGLSPGTPAGKAFGIVMGCEKPDEPSPEESACLRASSTSSAVLKADVGVGGASGLRGGSGCAASCTVGADESLWGAGGTFR